MHFHSVTHNFIGAHQVVVCKSKCSHEIRFSYETAAHVVYCAVHVLMRAFFLLGSIRAIGAMMVVHFSFVIAMLRQQN